MKAKLSILFSVLFLCLVMVTGCKNPRERQPEPPVITDIDTLIVTPEDAAKEMLEMQDEMIYCWTIDSTFRQMPEEIVIRIALNHPHYSIVELVNEYINNKERYDIDRQDYNKIKKFNTPDTVPNKPEPDEPNPTVQQLQPS